MHTVQLTTGNLMMWTLLLYTIIIILMKIIFTFLILVFTCSALYRVLYEPFKGECKCKTELHGKVVLITGGNSGIGFETAKDLARRGARIIIASRNEKRSEEAVADIKAATANHNVEHRYLNLGKFDSIRDFAKKFNKDFDRLDILVNNAGTGFVKKMMSSDGIDMLMQVNYVGPFLLTHLLLEKLIASKPSRIVIISSYAHVFGNLDFSDPVKCKSGYSWFRYSNTKLCDILWTRELAKRLPEGVTANVIHPGAVKTNIFNHIPYFRWLIFLIIDLLFKTPVEGAQTTIHLCVSPYLENTTGSYFVDCKKVEPASKAQDDALSEALWNKTMSLINR